MTEIEEISIDELAKLDLENISLVDVREEYKFIEMRVPGALCCPWEKFQNTLTNFPWIDPFI
ncbi:MAG: hypothetical protein Ct9H90mP11_09160 [Acidimicrobiales bacterium]|nr:MAG: hypothetical protein Ct9H90mP11_09160 [Acidimicrobiales bacterium]